MAAVTEYIDQELRIGFRRILNHVCRNPLSQYSGSCDRQYWSWRSKDLSNATLQYAGVPLLKLYRLSPEWMSDTERAVCVDSIERIANYLIRIQRKNGSFDQNYPFENHPGVVYDVLPLWLSILDDQDSEIGSSQIGRIREAASRALDYALGCDERYADISNHFAHYASVLLWCEKALDSKLAREKAEGYIERLMALQSEEGWFLEYDGPDPGYLSRSIAYGALICERPEWRELLEPQFEKAVGFLSKFAFSDGTFASNFGSRNTRIFYLYGVASFRKKSNAAESLWRWQMRRLIEGRAVRPSEMDFCNSILLLDDLLNAKRFVQDGETVENQPVEFPHWKSEEREYFKESGICILASHRAKVWIHLKKGGIWRACDTETGRLIYQDSGYVVGEGENVFVSACQQNPESLSVRDRKVKATYRFYQCSFETMGPLQMLFLRLLNLTLWRSQWLGDLGKRMIAQRLFLKREPLDAVCVREFELGETFLCRSRIIWSNEKGARLSKVEDVESKTMASAGYYEDSSRIPPIGEKIMHEKSPFVEEIQIDRNGTLIKREIAN